MGPTSSRLLPATEPHHRATVAAGFVTGMLSGARTRGIDPAALLRAAGVPADCLADPAARVPLDGYVALYNGVVAALHDEGFGLFAAPVPPGSFEFLCRAMVAPGTLGEALQRGARFLRLVLPELELEIARARDGARLEIVERRRLASRTADPRRVFAFEWLLRLLHGLACWLVRRPVALRRVAFPFPRPAHAADYALVYTEHSSFDAPRLVAEFDAALLDQPVLREASEIAAFLEGAPGKISILYRRDRDMVRAVRELLARELAAAPSLAQTARSLGMSERTLHRRLAEEGASFRGVREELRREAALEWLGKTRRSVARIASDLGYAEPSAFFRAFQAWTGESPSGHRKRVRAASG